MKTIIEEKKNKELEYPWLGRNESGLVILFRDYHSGTLLVAKKGSDLVGTYRNDWDMEQFNPLKGNLILSND